MAGLLVPGAQVLMTDKGPDFKGKLRYGWQAIKIENTWVGINTIWANRIVETLLAKKLLPEFSAYTHSRREVAYGQEKSKIDFLLEGPGQIPCYLEVKSVTLKTGAQAQFPDAVTTRGQKHLRELMHIKNEGHRAALVFLVQRDDVESFGPALEFDADYGKLLEEAKQSGVEILVVKTALNDQGDYFFKGYLPFD